MIAETLQPLFSQAQISERTRELAALISRDYHGRHVVIVGVLKGCFVFLADIIRHLDLDVTIDFVQIASYGARRNASGACALVKDMAVNIQGRDVLIIEDIVDTGETLTHLMAALRQRTPASIRVCALLDKQCRRRVPVSLDYAGFTVDDVFVVGYGLDFDERYRSLPDIFALPQDGPAGGAAGTCTND